MISHSDLTVEGLFDPDRIAFVGARRYDRSISGVGLHYARKFAANRQDVMLYAVGVDGDAPEGVRVARNLVELEGLVDAVFISAPSSAVAACVAASAAAGARLAVVISVPTSAEDRQAIEAAILDARRGSARNGAGMRVLGPGSAGCFTSGAHLCISSLQANRRLRAGGIALVGQSGGVLGIVGNRIVNVGGGIAAFVSTGEELDLTAPEVAANLLRESDVDCVGLYVESLDGLDAARHLAAVSSEFQKPVVVLKGGRSAAASDTVLSHSGRLASGGAVYDGVFEALGFQTVATPEALAIALALASQRRRRLQAPGRRVAVITDSGGMGAMAADAMADEGLALPDLDAAQSALPQLPGRVHLANPLDVSGADVGHADVLGATIKAVAEAGVVDVVVVQALSRVLNATARELAQVRPSQGLVIVTPLAISQGLGDAERDILIAADMLVTEASMPDVAAGIRAGTHAGSPGNAALSVVPVVSWSSLPRDERESKLALSDLFGLSVPKGTVVPIGKLDDEIALDLRFPLVVKLLTTDPRHKAASGGVRVGIRDNASLLSTLRDMSSRVAGANDSVRGLLVEEMAFGVSELFFSVTRSPDVGVIAIVGRGGTATELSGGARNIPAFAVPACLEGIVESFAVGAQASTIRLLCQGLSRLVACVEATPSIRQVELNPIIVASDHHAVVDAKVWCND